MDIKFDCTSCGTHILIDEAGAETSVQCPNCGQSLTVPPPSAANSIGADAAREKLEANTREKLLAEFRARGIEKPSVNDVIQAAIKLFSNQLPTKKPRIGWLKISGCRSVKVPVDLEAPEPENFDDYIKQFSKEQIDQAFGAQNYLRWQKGELSDLQLLKQKDCVMKLKSIMENW